jgi:hypothetical protein
MKTNEVKVENYFEPTQDPFSYYLEVHFHILIQQN